MTDFSIIDRGLFSGERTAVLIDGSNINDTIKNLSLGPVIERDLNWGAVRNFFTEKFNLLGVHYFTAVYQDENGHIAIQRLIDWLGFNGFVVNTKEARQYTTPEGTKRIKGNMDINIAITAMQLAQSPKVEHIVLATGDGDFVPLVAAIQNLGVPVTVMSSIQTKIKICSDGLRKQANYFLDIADMDVFKARRMPSAVQDLYENSEPVGN